MNWPLILAGPIVRRVEPRLVSVWIALSEARTVKVGIWPGLINAGSGTGVYSGTPPAHSGEAQTVRIATKLHLAVVTVKIEPPTPPLLPGQIYSYLVSFSATQDLKSEKLLLDSLAGPRPNLALGYEPNFLPSFALPPEELTDLRLAHGSCRKIHGPGRDGLASLDHIIKQTRLNGIERPHQLFLTGDQIYADDVARALLPTLTEVGAQLLSGSELHSGDDEPTLERLPTGSQMWPANRKHFPAARRQTLTESQAGFTSGEGDCHLLSFGEFCATYLMSFANPLWPDSLPDEFSDIFNPSDPPPGTNEFLTPVEEAAKLAGGFKGQLDHLKEFLETLPNTRRVLANVPVWMIFDDHEVTDDWYLTGEWRRKVLNSPLGPTVLRNGLLTYGLFQAWGNDPVAFESGIKAEMITRARELFPTSTTVGPNPAAAARLDEIFGLSAPEPLISWHYAVPGPKHHVLVLDTRTRRSFATPFSPPGLISQAALEQQIPPGPLPAGLEILVVVSPAPVLGLPMIEELIQPLMNRVFDLVHAINPKKSVGAAEKDPEPWSFEPFAFEALLRRLEPYQHIVFLSGDVHYSISMHLDYWKAGTPVARFVQFTSSALKHENSMKLIASIPMAQRLFGDAFVPLERLGWHLRLPPPITGGSIPLFHRVRLDQSPVLVATHGWPDGITIERSPDWAWRAGIARDDRPNGSSPEARPKAVQPDLLSADVDPAAAEGYPRVAARYSALLEKTAPRRVLFAANFGLVRFLRAAGRLVARQELLSVHPKGLVPNEPDAYSVHVLSLELTADEVPTIES
jgi:hypothetical protein